MGRKLIKVRAKHIKAGIPNKCNSCPVALAIKEQIKTNYVAVFKNQISLNKGYNNTIHMPRSVFRFVNKFDNEGRKAVKPFNFYLKIS